MIDVTAGDLIPTIISLAWPSVLQAVLSNCYAFNDFIFVAQIPEINESAAATAALSASVGLQIIAFSIHNCIPSGSNTYSAQYRGAKLDSQLAETFRAGFYACIVISTMVAIVGSLYIHQIALLSNSTPLVTRMIEEYFGVLLSASPAFGLMLLVDGVYKSCGDTITPLQLELVSLLLNTVFNYVLVIQLHWGIKGAAVATALSRFIPACYGLRGILVGNLGIKIYLGNTPNKTEMSFESDYKNEDWNSIIAGNEDDDKKDRSRSKEDLERLLSSSSSSNSSPRDKKQEYKFDFGNLSYRALLMLKIGIFESVSILIYGLVFTYLIRLTGQLGSAQQAGLGAGLRGLEWISFCFGEGFLVAASSMVGQCIGAGKQERAMRAALVCVGLSAASVGVMGIPFVIFPKHISSLMSRDKDIVKYCAQYIYVLGYSMTAVGLEMASYGVFMGAGLTRFVCLINGVLNVARIPLAVYFLYGSVGFWPYLIWTVGGVAPSRTFEIVGSFWIICFVVAGTAILKAAIFGSLLTYRLRSKLYFSDCKLT